MQSLPIVDNAVLDQIRTLGGDAFVGRLVNLFFESSRGYVQAMRLGLDNGDLQQVEDAAHTLKSSAGSLGASAAFGLSEAVENAARERQLDKTQQLFAELSDAYEKTCDELARAIEAS